MYFFFNSLKIYILWITQSVYTVTTHKLNLNNGTKHVYLSLHIRAPLHMHTLAHRQRVYECVFFVYFFLFYLIIFLVFDGRDAIFIQSDCLRVNIFGTTDCVRVSAWRTNHWDAMFLIVSLVERRQAAATLLRFDHPKYWQPTFRASLSNAQWRWVSIFHIWGGLYLSFELWRMVFYARWAIIHRRQHRYARGNSFASAMHCFFLIIIF